MHIALQLGTTHSRATRQNITAMATTTPLRMGMLLFPGFQILDVFGPLDVINVLSRSEPIDLSIIAETLQPVSNRSDKMTLTQCEQRVVPTHTIASVPALDVLIVPGGFGTRAPAHDVDALVAYIRSSYPTLQTIISVCTGAGLLARAGVLDGRRATTNKNAFYDMTVLGPKTYWVARARWVQDGNVWTSAGVTAGTDATLAWVADKYGDKVAADTANYLEHERVLDPNDDPFAALRGIKDVPPQDE
ncbi:uncharacterized protein EHS24_008782 [Apiotrichum porosum]|uniref:DJ-1/PfpI domain-containing protein n=1 Tax=Apiotrichum porosum TaxID=105984 RepID=A0A427XR54_9TREE|nr:uncharacterized protein EHS24_008782 [Apiotrichum porosum]RSH81339.1 hypothetical protein EHS24_008782 [Apiotrichum porosum]